MRIKPLLNPILGDDSLTRGLGDPEARVLVEWLVEQAERLAEVAPTENAGVTQVHRLCRRGRAISRFVQLWCNARERGAAVQLATVERFTWPFPPARVDPCELMQNILHYETCGFAA